MSAVPNYARMPGFGDLPGDDTNPNSPDYDTSQDEAEAARIDEICSDDAERQRYADQFAYASEPLSLRDVSGNLVTIEPNAAWCAWLEEIVTKEMREAQP